MSVQEVSGGVAWVEAKKDLTRPGENHYESEEAPFGRACFEFVEGRPIDLSLLARQGSKTIEGLRRFDAVVSYDVSEVVLTTLKTV